MFRREFLLKVRETGLALPSVILLFQHTRYTLGSALQSNSENLPWLRETQTPPAELPDNLPKLNPLLTHNNQPIKTTKAWRAKRAELLKQWQNFLGPIPFNPDKPKLKVLDEEVLVTEPHRAIRQLVEYEGEPDMKVRGYLLKPHPMPKSCPGVVVMHSTVNHTIRQPSGVEGVPEKAFALELAKQGVAAFCPECFLWVDKGERSYKQQAERFLKRFPNSKGMSKMIFDASRAVDILESVRGVDRMRIGAIGHSLGAKEALYLAAFDPRIRVAVSSEGGIGKNFSNWDAPWYLGSEFKHFPHDHHELLALVAPRPFLLVGGDSADGTQSWPYILEARRVYEIYNKPKHLGLLNHKKGHTVPPQTMQRMIEWLKYHL